MACESTKHLKQNPLKKEKVFWSVSRVNCFNKLGTGTHWTGGLVVPCTGLAVPLEFK